MELGGRQRRTAIVLVSGKRFAGKDHLVAVAKKLLCGGREGAESIAGTESVFTSTTDLFKEDFAVKFRDEIDHDRLLADREYKEQHRMMMTAYWTEIKTLDKTRYCARLLEQAQQWCGQRATTTGEHDVEFSLFFVTGVRYSWEIEFFEQALLGSATASGYSYSVDGFTLHELHGAGVVTIVVRRRRAAGEAVRLVRLRVQSPLEFKKQLGWHEAPIDSHETETELDSFDRWDLVFTNDSLGDEHTVQFLRDRLLPFIGSAPLTDHRKPS